MSISKPEREELSARIERNLVLSEIQLHGASLRYEKLEARLLDYSGKVSVAKQAIDTASLLEVVWAGPDGETKRIMANAQALEKKEEGSILVLRDTEDPENTIRIPLGKISLLRRIKQSIFER
jgi:hypothetical protein